MLRWRLGEEGFLVLRKSMTLKTEEKDFALTDKRKKRKI